MKHCTVCSLCCGNLAGFCLLSPDRRSSCWDQCTEKARRPPPPSSSLPPPSLLPLVFEIEFHIHSFDMCCKLLCVKQLHPHLAIVAERVWGLMSDLV